MIAVYFLAPETAPRIEAQLKLLAVLAKNHTPSPKFAHRVLLVTTDEYQDQATHWAHRLEMFFSSVSTASIGRAVGGNFLGLRNRGFLRAAEFVSSTYPDQPWVWMEAATPLQPEWMDALHAEYLQERVPFLGVLAESFLRKSPESNQYLPYGKGEAGKHLRFAIYPGNLSRERVMQISFTYPFEYELQLFSTPRRKISELVKTIWASASFRVLDDGRVAGDQVDEPPIRVMEPVNLDDAQVLHGCRDGSMERLVLNLVESSFGAQAVEVPEATDLPELREEAPAPSSEPPKKKVKATSAWQSGKPEQSPSPAKAERVSGNSGRRSLLGALNARNS